MRTKPPAAPAATFVPDPSAVLTPEQCAAWLQIPRRALQRAGVPHIVVSHKVRRYRAAAVLEWLDGRKAA